MSVKNNREHRGEPQERPAPVRREQAPPVC